MALLTVKKADGTTDIDYTPMTPSAGDKTPAIWRANSVGDSVALRPEFRAIGMPSPDGTRRTLKTNLVFPVVVVDFMSGARKVTGYITQVTETKIFLAADDETVAEAIAQGANLTNTALMRECAKVGFAPN